MSPLPSASDLGAIVVGAPVPQAPGSVARANFIAYQAIMTRKLAQRELKHEFARPLRPAGCLFDLSQAFSKQQTSISRFA